MGRPKNPNNTLHKVCPTCETEFTCEKRKEKKFCSKKCAANSAEVKEKNRRGVENAFNVRYGGHPMTTNPQTKEKLAARIQETYGMPHYSQTSEFIGKVKSTKKERYGDENYNNMSGMIETCQERYGVDHYIKTTEYREKYKKTCLKKYGVDHASKSKEFKVEHKKLMFEKFLTSDRFTNFTTQFDLDEYKGVTRQFDQRYSFKCNRCNKIEDHLISNGKYVKCSKCDKSMTEFQASILDYIKSIMPNQPVISNDRTILYPQEIDIYISDKKIGIECDGLYWHSDVSGAKNKNYHINKTKYAINKGIRLIHVFENEWNHKQDIVKSILKNMLANDNVVIYARKCVVKEIATTTKKNFLNVNHIQGNDHATKKLGLYHGTELVSVMTFVKSRFDKKVEWEMSRFCSKLGHTIVGGSSKLFSNFVKTTQPKSIVSYSDRRYFSGEVYLKLGFTFIDNTSPNYFYTLDGYNTLVGRQGWQKGKLKNKLKTFDPTISEWENMKMNGLDRIWDCGNSKWVWINKNNPLTFHKK
jgi:hypothetical protein